MEVQFCNNCENILYLHKEVDGDKLYYCCKSCNNQLEIESSIKKIYQNTNEKFDKSLVMNKNPYITHDVTIPTIYGNSNIQCKNKDCPGETTEIKFIKYDDINMKYLYICNHCGTKWKNSL